MTQKIDILLVEDDADDIELAVHALREEKLANGITIARDGEQALDIIFHRGQSDPHMPPPRLILLDLKLPKVDGLQVLRAVKSDPRTQPIPIVVMTSSKEERDLVESYKLGVNAYVQKPVRFDEFRQIVKELGLFWLVINQVPASAPFEA